MALLKKIDNLYGDNQLERALGLLTKALDRSPDSLPLLRRRARVAAELGHRNLALADLERLITLEPQKPLHWIGKAELQDDYYRALGVLEHGLRRMPNDPDLLIAKARHFAGVEHFDEAIALLTQALATAPQNASLWLARAQLRHKRIRTPTGLPGGAGRRPAAVAAELQRAIVDVESAIRLAPTPTARALRDDLQRLNLPGPPPPAPASERRPGFWARLWRRFGTGGEAPGP